MGLGAFELVLLRRARDAPCYPEDVLRRPQKPWAWRERSWGAVLTAGRGDRGVARGEALAGARRRR